MINKTILLLIYYYDYEMRNHEVLKHLVQMAYLPFDLYLYEPLKKTFSRVILYDYLKRTEEIGLKAVNKEVIELVRKEHPEYVLWTSFYYEIQPSTLDLIRKEGSLVVGWFFDDEWRFDDYSKWWIPHLDYSVTNTMEAVPKYRELGARVIQTIPNTGIAIDRDWSKTEEKYDVSFVGTRLYADREQWIGELRKRSIPVHLFGLGFGGYVSFEEMIDIFKSSKINLNFSKEWRSLKPQIKGRVFQACMAGGFLLTEYVPGIENYFEIDKEIVCFHNTEEMIKKIIYYLDHDEERRAIARAGWKRATSQYTSFHMVSRVFHEIEQDVAARGKANSSNYPELKMPRPLRRKVSGYYLTWGHAFSEANHKGLWRQAFVLSIAYNPLNIRAWLYYALGFLPFPVRRTLIRFYQVARKSL